MERERMDGEEGEKGVRKIYHNRKDEWREGGMEREKEERSERMRKRDHIFDILLWTLTENVSASKTQWE